MRSCADAGVQGCHGMVILENLVKQVKAKGYEFDSENPLRISGLEFIKDENQENKYGLLLKVGNDTKIINDDRFAYSKNEIQLGNENRPLHTKENGLSRVFLGADCDLYSYIDFLADSGRYGRVVIVDAEGGTPKFSTKNYQEAIRFL